MIYKKLDRSLRLYPFSLKWTHINNLTNSLLVLLFTKIAAIITIFIYFVHSYMIPCAKLRLKQLLIFNHVSIILIVPEQTFINYRNVNGQKNFFGMVCLSMLHNWS